MAQQDNHLPEKNIMDGPTFRLLRQAMGWEVSDIAAANDVNPRTIRRWESGANPLPAFAQTWMAQKWSDWLARIGAFIDEVEDFPAGTPVEIVTYKGPQALARTGSTETLSQVEATNEVLAVLLALADLEPVATPAPKE
ncbi:helix-turn-helix domain-containing protein [Actinobaculum suis]|uniref:helix-turn-helix domain-containing protein n=1 Tax=Actinobaculum suis TaxID=1657 RepID=UPI000808790B|nr:transcriptional regulator [Actinobaculum suis]OCA94902.1 hypothetical protein ACU20_05965 [Actinobaculum suis]OCA95490.1 hypothetical protein ACU21_04185 [Actinobaculum suis]